MQNDGTHADQRKGRPFTEENINEIANSITGDAAHKTALKKNWRALLMEELRPTDAQKRNIQNIPGKAVQEIQDALSDYADKGGKISVHFGTPDSDGVLEISINRAAQGSSDISAQFTYDFFKCTFDANCGNWRCGFNIP